MHSELFKIPYEWGGVPIFGFGVLFVLWLIASIISVVSLGRRHGWGAETLSALPMLLMLGAAIVMLPRVFPDGLPIRGYGVMLLAGIVSGVGMAIYRARRGGVEPEVILSMAIWLVLCGVVGARLFYVIEYWDEKFSGLGLRGTLLEIINIPQGGLVIYGGFIGAAVGFVAFVRKNGLPLLATADLIAPSMMVGLAFGRVGCLLNGCCYGGQTDLPWHVTFPADSAPYEDQASRGELVGFKLESREKGGLVVSRVDAGSPAANAGLKVGDAVRSINGVAIKDFAEARPIVARALFEGRTLQLELADGRIARISAVTPPLRSRPAHPTQIYSAIDAALLGWLLWAWFPFRTRDGQCIALMLTIHPITRFLLEVIRTDEPAVFGTGLSISQNISVVLLLIAGGLWWYVRKQPGGATWPLVRASNRPRETVVATPASRTAATKRAR